MKLTKEQETKLTEMAFANKSNKDIAEELGIKLEEVHAARSRLGITIPKVKAMMTKVVKASARTKEEIEAEIFKVNGALMKSIKKSQRCRVRLEQLTKELEG